MKRVNEGRDSNWAFVQYSTQQERDNAVRTLNGVSYGDQRIIVKPAKDELEFDPNEPVTECWFCLGAYFQFLHFMSDGAGSPSSDKALIVSVGHASYLAIDKGPISEDHVLIVPTHHYPNTLKMSQRLIGFFKR